MLTALSLPKFRTATMGFTCCMQGYGSCLHISCCHNNNVAQVLLSTRQNGQFYAKSGFGPVIRVLKNKSLSLTIELAKSLRPLKNKLLSLTILNKKGNTQIEPPPPSGTPPYPRRRVHSRLAAPLLLLGGVDDTKCQTGWYILVERLVVGGSDLGQALVFRCRQVVKKEVDGVYLLPVFNDLVMQVRARAFTRAAHPAYHLAAFHTVAGAHFHLLHMGVVAFIPIPVADDHMVAISPAVVPGFSYRTIARSIYGRACGGRKVDTGMQLGCFIYGVYSVTKTRCHALQVAVAHGLYRRYRREHALFSFYQFLQGVVRGFLHLYPVAQCRHFGAHHVDELLATDDRDEVAVVHMAVVFPPADAVGQRFCLKHGAVYIVVSLLELYQRVVHLVELLLQVAIPLAEQLHLLAEFLFFGRV